MKTNNWALIIMFLLSIFISQAFAQGVGGGGSTGGGLSKIATRTMAACEEGRKSWFSESVPGSDRKENVRRECKNGSYYDLSNYIYNPQTKCREGRKEVWIESDSARDSSRQVIKVCRNGKWVDDRP